MSEAGTLERLLLIAGEALARLPESLGVDGFSDYVYELGVSLPDGFAAGVSAELSATQTAANRIEPLLQPLRDAIAIDAESSAPALIAAGAAVAVEIGATMQSLRSLVAAFKQAAVSISDPDQRARVEDFAAEMAKRILSRLVLEYVDRYSAQAAPLLAVIGLVDDRMVRGVAGDPDQHSFYLRRIHPNRLGKLLTDPVTYFEEMFRWGAADFDAAELLERIRWWSQALGRYSPWISETALASPDVDGLDIGWFRLRPDHGLLPPGLGIELQLSLAQDFEDESPIGESLWTAYVKSGMRAEAGLRASLSPTGDLAFSAAGSPTVSARTGLRWTSETDAGGRLIGLAWGTYLEAKEVDLALSLDGLTSRPALNITTRGLDCVLDVGKGDSFLRSITGGGRGKSDISLGASWSPSSGLRFSGSAAIEIAIPAHASIGPATLETVYLVSKLSAGSISLEISAAIRAEIGPFKAVVDRVGAEFVMTFPDDGGNLGPAQLDVGFKPPEGVGLAIDGGGFSGGGFLRIAPDGSEYSGTLELQFQEVIDVKAVGVLNTRLPDGSEGYSLILVITAEFAPIQLSFGFTLNGVGGLLGVNRTVLQEQLRLGLRDGVLDSILFPKDVVANAPRIINDLKRVFPAQQGRFLIGPMGKLGWGTPTIVSLELGIILEIPRPAFFLVGILKMALPAEDAVILKLKVSFVGAVDFATKQASFDAVLIDSRILAFTLTGGMAVRIYWGENANFLLTAGGFHPAYNPPPLALPPIERLAIALLVGNPRLRAEAYFAITSNTVQFGAKIEVEAGVKIFIVYGFVAFDALITFDPFHFIAYSAGMVAVRSGSSTLFSIKLDLTLEGPSPWFAKIRASFEIGFIFKVTIPVSFDKKFGVEEDSTLAAISVGPLIEEALKDDRNWRAFFDASARAHVSTRELPPLAPVLLAPVGGLAVAQKVAPLNLPLARFGSRRVEGKPTFKIVDVQLGGSGIDNPPAVVDQFPGAQFLDLTDAEKLSRRSFEPFDAGIQIAASDHTRADFQRAIDLTYEVIYFRKPRRRLLFRLRDLLIDTLLIGSAAGRSKLSAARRVPTGLGTPEVKINPEQFVIAGVDDLIAHPGLTTFASESAAAAALKAAVANDLSLTGRLQVVAAYELAA